MPFSKCPICGQVSHLSISGDAEAWYRERGKKIGEEISGPCFGCWKELKEYEVVEIIAKPDGASDVQIGDVGTVLLVVEASDGSKGFEVECVSPDGSSRWVHTFERHHLRYSPLGNRS